MSTLVRRLALTAACIGALALVCGLGLGIALHPPSIPVPAARDWVFRDVTLVEPGREARPGRTLEIRAGAIFAVDRPGAGPGDAPDLEHLIVAPGLIDMHVHYPPAAAVGNAELWSLLLLAHGVTSVREMGSIDGSIFDVREAVRAGRFPGPRIFACGEILDGAPPSFPSNRVVRTAAEARVAVEDQAAAGADCIKVYNMLSPEALSAIREASALAGLPVIGHAPHSVSLEQAGVVDLQHGTGAVRIDPETVGRLDFLFTDWGTVDAARIAEVARVSLDQGIAHTPTLWNSRMRLLMAEEAVEPLGQREDWMARDTGLRHLPRFWIDVWAALWGPPFPARDEPARAAHARFRSRQAALTAGLHARGVRIHAGTDTLMPFVAPGSALHGELEALVEAGLELEAVLRIATCGGGESLGVPKLGTLEAGAPADLVFLREDPRADLAALGRIEAVLAAGRLYRRADLEAALARYDAHFHGRLYGTVMGAISSVIRGGFAPDDAD